MKITDKDIVCLDVKVKNLSARHIKSKYPDEYEYVITRYSDSLSFRESWCRILNRIEERPVCKICGEPVKFIGYRTSPKDKLFSIGCCNKHVQQCQEIKDKIRNTFLEKYGVSNPNKTQEVRDKIKQTCFKKYGVDHNWKSEECKEKCKQTCLEKYGVEYSFQSENNKQKSKQTWISKYGVDHPLKSQEVQSRIDHVSPIEKSIQTKRKNHSFNTSKVEEQAYELLITKFKKDDILRQYKSKEYPFACDFYIKSINTYIEIQGMWTHGEHAYDENSKDDINKVEKWKSKNTKFYDNAIKTWTIRDVTKRKIAKENNLNFFEFWSILDLKKFLT